MKYQDFIARFERQRKTSEGVLVTCPAHDDNPKTPSLSVSPARDGGVLLKCFAGCETTAVVAALRLTMKDLFAKEPAKAFVAPIRDSEPFTPTERPVIEKTYTYHDATGKDVYQVVRLKPKSFRQRHLVGDKWVWAMDGVIRVLYRLPEILKAQTVWIAEGEKDADNLAALGFQSTCNVGGGGKWLDGYSDSLRGKDVVICGDNDKTGAEHVELVFNSIAGTARTVKIVKLPVAVKDVSDFIATFKTKAEATESLVSLAAEALPHIKGIGLPVFTVDEAEEDYRRFARSMNENSFSLSKWLPSFRHLRPLVPGELVFVIGDTGTGKTGILQQIATAALPLPTLMFEMELPRELMFERFAAMAAKLPCHEIEMAYRSPCNDSLSETLRAKLRNLFICTEARLTLAKIEEYILRSELKIGEKPKVVLIDYIQLISATGPNRREKMSDIAEGLKALAKATRTIIIVSSQVARNKENPEPTLHSAKESGSIESSCGLLLGIWRDEKDGGLLNVKILKSTKGGAGLTIPCNFNGALMTITERAKPSPISDEDVPHYNPGE